MLTLFTAMLARLLPLYLTMGAGFGLARRSGDITKNLAVIQIYFLAPIVILTNVIKLELKSELFLLPLVFFIACMIMSTLTRLSATALKCDGIPALAQAGGSCNNGYLGIPIATILFAPDLLPLFIFAGIGGTIYENTFGYYTIARGQFSAREALIKLLSLPTLYAMIAGLILSINNIALPEIWADFARNALGAFIIIGALIIGFGVAQVRNWRFDWKYLGTILSIKFIGWPIAMLGLLFLEDQFIGFFDEGHRDCLLLISIMPLAANSAAFAALFNITPDRMATAIALSTMLGMVLIPAYAILLGLASPNVLNL